MSRDEKFMEKWKLTRQHGRKNYTLIRGVLYAILLLLMLLLVNIFKDSMDNFTSNIVLYLIIAFIIAYFEWGTKESKYLRLMKENNKN
ncbi:hypothetical protein PRVXT_002773 [Proteinivorax tanatarense]|uniref:Uncharacterized protein n=1 Tax=Proteinivorax tanatarense TaxID=1260629 RepID=A0AAU7VL11_9FIRM